MDMATVTAPTAPRNFLEFEALLKDLIPNYQERPNQQALAAQIELAIATRMTLMAQAGCGTGKSLAYLIPAILSGKRVIIATATKALQDQLQNKDLPLLAEAFDFGWAVLKGRSNYFCGNRAAVADDLPEAGDLLEAAAAIAAEGRAATQADFPQLSYAQWAKVASDADFCTDGICKTNGLCQAKMAKTIAKEAQIVVVNHAVLAMDLWINQISSGKATMLGNYDVVVLDEAHEFASFVEGALATEFSEGSLRGLTAQLRNFAERHLDAAAAKTINAAIQTVNGAQSALWKDLDAIMARPEVKGSTQLRIREATITEHPSFKHLDDALENLHKVFSNPKPLERVSEAKITDVRKQHGLLKAKALSLSTRFSDIVNADVSPNEVRWIETEAGTATRGPRKVLKIQPIDVSDWLAERLWSKVTGVLTSATLPFEHIARTLGLDK